MTNAVFMPYVLAFNRPAIEPKIDRLAAYLGVSGGFDGFVQAVLELRAAIGVPHTLGGLKSMRAAAISSPRWPLSTPRPAGTR
jgi:alcohol dehydrogenase class IV